MMGFGIWELIILGGVVGVIAIVAVVVVVVVAVSSARK
jgi:hypothetical protein